MEEPSIHSIGDINSAETTKSKCESVNVKSFSISFPRTENRSVPLRDFLRSLRDRGTCDALALIYCFEFIPRTVMHIYGKGRYVFAEGIESSLISLPFLILLCVRTPSYLSRFKVPPDFRDLAQTPLVTLPIQHDDILRSIFFFWITRQKRQKVKKKKKKGKCISFQFFS